MFAKFLALLVAGLVLWTIAARPSGAHGDKSYYRVHAYDTLWSIASANYGGDVRDAVWRIQKANHLPDATIQPGERLLLPSAPFEVYFVQVVGPAVWECSLPAQPANPSPPRPGSEDRRFTRRRACVPRGASSPGRARRSGAPGRRAASRPSCGRHSGR